MLGATGTGKSTLIESLINYLTDVSYSDDHRFSTISKSDDERQRILHQVVRRIRYSFVSKYLDQMLY